jgi:hypothetical protein
MKPFVMKPIRYTFADVQLMARFASTRGFAWLTRRSTPTASLSSSEVFPSKALLASFGLHRDGNLYVWSSPEGDRGVQVASSC